MEITHNMHGDFKYQRKLLRRKLGYKRSFTFIIWAAAMVLVSYAKSPADNLDVQPQVGQFSDVRWRFVSDNSNSGSGQNYNYNLRLGENDTDFQELPSDNYTDNRDGNCTPPAINDFPDDLFTQSERQGGAVVIHFIVSAYIFYAIAIICDDYFVPSIECICDELSLPSDVAGATFMAIATSSPELFTNVIGTFITEGDIGIGTIVGSAVFNILAIAACCGLATKSGLQLEWWPLTRDCAFYSVSVLLLYIMVVNRQVYWYEAVVLVAFYFVYIFVMYYNTAFKNAAEKLVFGIGKDGVSGAKKYSRPQILVTEDSEKTPLISSSNDRDKSFDVLPDPSNEDDLELSSEMRDEILITKALHQSEIHAEEEREELALFKLPRGEGTCKWVEWFVGWPIRLILTFTIPDCREQRMRAFYPITFIMCIVYIASLSYVVSWMMTVIGHTFGIPDSVMGLTFIAAGTSVPEAVSSIIVARQGLGAMGISNSIGSNTFDILICLGLPWLIRCSIIATHEVNYVLVNSSGFELTIVQLMASLFVLYIALACNRFVLDTKVSLFALAMYAAFIILSSLIELNVFYPVNLPTCES